MILRKGKMSHTIMYCGERVRVSAKAIALLKRYKNLEDENRRLAKKHQKYSADSAIYNAIAEAFSTAIALFLETHGTKITEDTE